MADSKITALTALTAADPVNDMFPIVDVSDTTMAASGTTKRISANNILSSSPTASGALTVTGLVTAGSATITGNLTVNTSTFFVDSSADKVGVGTTSLSGEKLTVAGNISANAWIGRSNIAAPTGDCSIFRSADNTLAFGITSSTAMTLNSTGNLVLKGGTAAANGVGVTFPATQVASSDANCLDDYEEGAWVGTIGGTTTNPTTPLTSTGRYTKIGRQVSVEIGFYGDTTGASGRITVSGLPFTSNASLSRPGIILMDTMGTFTGSPVAYLGAGVTLVELFASNSNAAYSNVTHNAGAGRALYMELTYTV